LHQAIQNKEIPISSVERELEDALKKGNHWPALFHLTALALSFERASFAKYLDEAFHKIRGEAWSKLETDDIEAWLRVMDSFSQKVILFHRIPLQEWDNLGGRFCAAQSAYPLETLGAWLVAGMTHWDAHDKERRACEKLLDEIGRTTGERLVELGRFVAGLGSDRALELVVAGLGHRRYVREILPMLLQGSHDALPWDRSGTRILNR
jgi:hypothetical protein